MDELMFEVLCLYVWIESVFILCMGKKKNTALAIRIFPIRTQAAYPLQEVADERGVSQECCSCREDV
jgi:hypothetical protein